MYSPNILITNFCNQNCSFCFAAEEMGNKIIKKEMSLEDFKTTLLKMKKNPKIKVIKLLGGEPTLHSKFKEIIKLSLKEFKHIELFTNGFFSKKIHLLIKKNLFQIKCIFNISTPGFQNNEKLRNIIVNRIKEFGAVNKVTLSITINPNIPIGLDTIVMEDVLRYVGIIRISISNFNFSENPNYSFADFKNVS